MTRELTAEPTVFPLSPAQLGMWYAQQLDPALPLSEAQYIEMRGPLELAALGRAAVLAGREFGSGVLRLVSGPDGPSQVVNPRIEPVVGFADFRDRPDPVAAALAWMRADAAAPIDLLGPDAGISKVIRVGESHHLWYTRAHHILIDGFGSVTMLYRVAELYNAAVRGQTAPPGTAASLSEVHEAELAYRVSTRYAADEHYWRAATAGMPQRCSLVSATAPAAALGREARAELAADMSARLDAAARRFDTSPAAVVMAAVALYYARLTATEDVVLSLPVSGRTTALLRRSGGMIANVVPLRVRVPRAGLVGEVLDAVRVAASGALRHQRFRHEDMRSGDHAELGRGMTGPVINIMLFPAGIDFEGVDSSLHVLTSGPIDDLFVNFYQHGANAPIHVDFAANPRLYDEDSLARHHRRFLAELDSLLSASAETPLAELAYTTTEDEPLLSGAHGRPAPATQLLPEILAAGLRRAGRAAVAVVAGDRQLTYGELDALSNRLARRLLRLGRPADGGDTGPASFPAIGPESIVLLALPRSLEAVVALWAVAKTGAAFAPLGADMPPDRMARIAAECDAKFGLCFAKSADSLPISVTWMTVDDVAPTGGRTGEYNGAGVGAAVRDDTEPGTAATPSVDDAGLPVTAPTGDRPLSGSELQGPLRVGNPAYVVFTSGSTGVPKGVGVTHAGLAALAGAIVEAYRVRPGERVLQCLNPSFDASVLEWLMAFASGATLVVAEADPVLGPELAGLVRDYGITQVCSTPAVLSTLDPEALEGVRAVSSGGEPTPPEIVARFGIGRELLNSYGPSETTVAVTYTGGLRPGVRAGIGSPIPGVGMLVLDRWLRPVPIGMAGELYVTGQGLARGYVGRAGVTAERFVPAPWGPPGTRMYRTGDVVRWNGSGVPEYVGRSDFQVKLRGMRIELGEIDAALDAHPGVDVAVTVARSAPGGGTVLAAYVVPHAGADLTEAELIAHAAQGLPAYMVPATVTVLGALPLTANGKVDRRALPEPVVTPQVRRLEPVTDTERALCGLFAEILGTDEIGPDTSFFALGGDSIMAITLVSRARATGLVFSAREVFDHRTPAALAAILTRVDDRPARLAELPGGGVGRMPLTPIASWLLSRPGWEGFAQSMVVRLPVGVDRATLLRTVRTLLAGHDMLRAQVVCTARGPQLEVPAESVEDELLLARIDCTTDDSESAVIDQAIASAVGRLDPRAGRMLALTWMDAGPGQAGRLAIAVHHLACDAVSWRILLPDLVSAWTEASTGTPAAAHESGTSMRTWSHALRELAVATFDSDDKVATDGDLRESEVHWPVSELGYWRSVLREDPLVGARRLDPSVDTRRTVRQIEVEVPGDISAALVAKMGVAYRCGVEEALLAGLALALARWRGPTRDASATVVMVERHGRDEVAVTGADLSHTVGWFTAQVPVRLGPVAVQGDSDTDRWAVVDVAVKTVKEQVRGVPRGGFGFGLLRYLNPETAGELALLPEPQVGFNYLGQIPDVAAESDWLPVSMADRLGGHADPGMPLAAVVSVDAVALESETGTRIRAVWQFASKAVTGATVEQLAREWVSAVTEIAELVARPGAGGLTPGDVPLLPVTQAEIDTWAADFGRLTDIWPLTPLQRGLLFQSQFAEGGPDGYSVQAVIDVEGDLDPDRLQAAARALVRRHAGLRAGFAVSETSAAQVIPELVEVPCDYREAVDATPEQLDAIAAQELRRPFDVARPPLIRFLCIALGQSRFRLVITNHHLILDGWSMPLLFAELIGLYETSGDDTGFAAPVPFSDHLSWLARRDLPAARQAWSRALSGLDGPTLVVSTASRPDTAPAPVAHAVPLSASVIDDLRRTAAAHQVTLNTLVQVGWALLLAELTGSTDVVFGATVSGRPPELPGAERMIGMLVNTVPVRIALNPAETLTALLTRIQREQAALADHQHLGLDEIQAITGHVPLFDTATVFESYPVDAAALTEATRHADLTVTGVQAHDGTHYPLSLAAYSGDGLRLELTRSPGHFDAEQADAIAETLSRLLISLTGDPQRHTSRIHSVDPLITAAIRSGSPVGPACLLPDLLTAVSDPQTVAVTGAHVDLTYGALDRASNRLARSLIAAGAGPERAVLVGLPRSVETMVAVWAIAKTGAAFVPVDIAQPADRTAAIALECDAVLGITDLVSRAGLPNGPTWLCVDDPVVIAEVADRSADPVTDFERLTPLRTEQPAYIVFTSGSTGTPKGVVVTHAGLPSLVAAARERGAIGPAARVLLCVNPAFDAAILVWLATFAAGATLVVAAPEANAGAELAAAIRAGAATHLVCTPGVLATLDDADLAGVGTVVMGGEPCPPTLVARLGVGRDLVNSYGPAEATVAVTFGDPMTTDTASVLGGPVPGVTLLVLDGWLRPVPSGAVGELYLRGPALARGYAARPGLSAARFVADPFTAGACMYRTGDLMRCTTAGFEYAGRTDFQVKIRGIRVEPSELDAVLLTHPRVAAAVTIARRNPLGAMALCSYVTSSDIALRGAGSLSGSELLAWVTGRLPRYLVPSSIQVLGELPRTSSGKVDTRALPEPVVGHAEYVKPIGVQAVVARTFAEVLGIDRVGAYDDFFVLGGDSLIATRVAARLSTELGAPVSVRTLFEVPVVAALAERLATVEKDAEGPELVRRDRAELVPLSPAQQRMWFVNRLDPASGAYNVPVALRLSGRLELAALRSALGDVLERHETLRTVYPDVDGVGVQRVMAAADIEVEPIAVTAERLPEAVAHAVGEGFDVTTAVPLRLRLFRLDADEHVIVLVMHHIATDGFSMGPLTRDVAAAYAARTEGVQPSWEPLPVQYADYALWQRDRLGSEAEPGSLLARQVDYWRQALAGLPDLLELPTDRMRPARASHRAAECVARVDGTLSDAIEACARAHRATPFMVVHAALAVLLSWLCGSGDVVVGTPVAGRGRRELDDLVGMFVNTLVLRTEIRAEQGFDALLDRVRDIDLAAFEHADVPFERLVDLLAPVRSEARHPLVQVMLVFQNLALPQLRLPELTVAPLELPQTASRFDLSLTVTGDPDGLDLRCCYATDLFDADTVSAFLDRLTGLLREMTTTPAQPVGDVEILTASEYQQLQATPAPVAAPRNLAALMADAVAANPDGIALVCGERRLTYRQLDERADRLAHRLRAAGAGPETLVAVGIPRSVESVLAVWGITRSGAAFVPVDPAYPPDRIARIIDVSGVCLGLTVTAQRGRLPGTVDWLCLDDMEDEPGEFDSYTLEYASPAHPAYVIFTSGSTGTPKGVVVTHAGLANLAAAQRERDDITPDSRVLHVASPSFDASVVELVMAVSAAATLVVAPPAVFAGPDLAELLAREEVSHIALTPSALSTVDPAGMDALRLIVTGGEPCPPDLVAAWAAPGRNHFNDYGPTEATVWAAGARLHPGAPITIGTAAPGMRTLVLDNRLHPVPDGVVGELYLSGIALARGYFGRYDLTAVRFVALPHGAPGERMYRTGDLVRRRHGDLEYLGRTDTQVKLRGLRIELGEVGAALTAEPGVARAVAIVRADVPGGLLAAYVAPDCDAELDVTALKKAVAQRLPSYMVPASIQLLPELPRTANGKLDLQALPAPQPTSAEHKAPEGPMEEAVARAFAEVLGIDRVWRDDDFFALGGNSLIATQVVARLGAALDTAVPVRALFDAPTVTELAALVASGHTADRPRPGPRPRPEQIPLSAAQQRMWFLNRYDPGSPIYNIPGAFEITGALDVSVLRAAIDDVVARHETLRTVYPAGPDGLPWQEIAATVRTPVIEIDVPAEDVAAVLTAQLSRGFDITRETPLRVSILHLAADRTVLALAVHHIAADGWSMAPLARDIMHAFTARTAGNPPDWQPLPLQYADYALWQRELLGSESDPDSLAARQLEFWRTALADAPEIHTLPTDRPRPTLPTGAGDRVEFTVPAPVHDRIQVLARSHGATPFMVVHAALSVLLARLSGRRDVLVGSVVAGRGEGEFDDLVGMFVNTVVLRARLEPAAGFADALDAVRRADLAVYGNMDLPFERLVEVLAPARTTAHHPLFQVLLAFQNVPLQSTSLSGLEIRPLTAPAPGSKFDLEWMLAEQFGAAGEPAGITGSLIYATDLFDRTRITAMVDAFLGVLETATATPDTAIGALEVATLPTLTADTHEPARTAHPRPARRGYRAPRTPAEQTLVTAFETVLESPRIGVDDNFFDSGGNSMAAVRLVTLVREQTGLPMPVQWMFLDPTPAGLAARLAETADQPDVEPAMRVLLPMRAAGTAPALFCVHPAIGLAWCYGGLVRYIDGDRPVYGIQSPGVADGGSADRTVRQLAVRYVEEILRVQPDGPYHLLGYSAGGPLAHAVAVELRRRDADVPALIMIDSRADVAVPDDTALPPLSMLLSEFGGIDVPPELEDLTPAQAAGLLEAAGISFTAAELANFYSDLRHLLRQLAAHDHQVFDGDLLFFTAAGNPDPVPNVATWRPYIEGVIHDRPLPYTHNEMITAAALARLGPAVDAYLHG